MTVDDLLGEVDQRGLRLDLRGEELRLIGPPGAADFDLRSRLRSVKPELLVTMRRRDAEFRDLLAELTVDRDWCRDAGLLLPGEPDGAGYRTAVEALRERRGLLVAWRLVVEHYARHVLGDLPRGPIGTIPNGSSMAVRTAGIDLAAGATP